MKITYEDEFQGLTDKNKDMISYMVKSARENFERDGDLMPTAIIGHSGTGKMEIVGARFGNQAEKEAVFGTIKAMIKKSSADSIMLILESYTIPQEYVQDFMANRHKYPMVSSHPKAIDIIMFSYENDVGAWSAVVKVDCKAKKVLDEDVHFMQADSQTGLISGFIPKKEGRTQ